MDETWVHAGKQLSAAQRKMLAIVGGSRFGLTARAAAGAMWPRSESWGTPTSRGRSTLFGQGAQMRAGTILRDLHDAGLVVASGSRSTRWQATAAGREFLGSAVREGGEGQGTLL